MARRRAEKAPLRDKRAEKRDKTPKKGHKKIRPQQPPRVCRDGNSARCRLRTGSSRLRAVRSGG